MAKLKGQLQWFLKWGPWASSSTTWEPEKCKRSGPTQTCQLRALGVLTSPWVVPCPLQCDSSWATSHFQLSFPMECQLLKEPGFNPFLSLPVNLGGASQMIVPCCKCRYFDQKISHFLFSFSCYLFIQNHIKRDLSNLKRFAQPYCKMTRRIHSFMDPATDKDLWGMSDFPLKGRDFLRKGPGKETGTHVLPDCLVCSPVHRLGSGRHSVRERGCQAQAEAMSPFRVGKSSHISGCIWVFRRDAAGSGLNQGTDTTGWRSANREGLEWVGGASALSSQAQGCASLCQRHLSGS